LIYIKERMRESSDRLRGMEFGAGMSRRSHKRTAMGHAESFRTFDRNTRWRVGVTGLAGALLIAGAVVAFSSVDADARPQYVTKSKPCGSCHPPNNPPKKK
jgi:hypothetical protein